MSQPDRPPLQLMFRLPISSPRAFSSSARSPIRATRHVPRIGVPRRHDSDAAILRPQLFEPPFECRGFFREHPVHAMLLDKGKTAALLYIDGASSNNGSRAATAGYGIYGSSVHRVSRALPTGTSNSRAELHALVGALFVISRSKWKRSWVLGCDSEYVIRGITSDVWFWRLNRWRRKGGRRVKNVDLWERIVSGVRGLQTRIWLWKVARNANPADRLAKMAAARAR